MLLPCPLFKIFAHKQGANTEAPASRNCAPASRNLDLKKEVSIENIDLIQRRRHSCSERHSLTTMKSNKHGPLEGILPLFLLPLYILAFLQLILFGGFAILGHIVFDPIIWLVSTGACESICSTLSSIPIIKWLLFGLAPSYVVTNGKRSLPIDKENIRSPNDGRSNKKKRLADHKHQKKQGARVIKTTSPPSKEFKELFSSHGASTTIIAIWWIIYSCAFENKILILANRYITWLIGVDATNFDVDEFIARDTKYRKKVRKATKKRDYAANLGDGIRKGVKVSDISCLSFVYKPKLTFSFLRLSLSNITHHSRVPLTSVSLGLCFA